MSSGKLTPQDRKQLAKWMKKPSIQLDLLYRASRDGCSAPTFHAKCNNKGSTFSVGYTSDGYVVGGYASVDFDSSQQVKPDQKAFLFRLRKAGTVDYMDYPATNAAIHAHTSHGPAFIDQGGKVHELLFITNSAYGKQVNVGAGGGFNKKNHSATDIAGSQQFTDVEVYRVTESLLVESDEPWRKMAVGWQMSDLETLKQDLSSYVPPEGLNIRQANVLLVGQVGAGKSSVCNTINSLFRGHVTSKATTGSCERSLTTMFRKYEFRSTIGGKSMRFRLCDTMGLEDSNDSDSMNFPYLLDGHIQDRFQFNPAVPISPGSPGYKTDPTVKHKIHVVAFVVDGTSVNLLSRVLLDKLKAMRVLVNQRSIPMMILMTKIDKIDELVSKDLKSVYHSVQVRDTMEELSDKTGVPMSYIMPVKSYDRETELEPAVDILTLTALRQMLRLADDFFEDQMDLLNIHSESESDEDGEAGVARNLNVRQEKGVDKKGISGNKNIL